MQTTEQALEKLSRSRFRSGFRLDEGDIEYIGEKGLETIRRHAEDFVRTKIAPSEPKNDGKQTPMRGHPVFKAMHATACCCRGCLGKWYRVPKGVPLTDDQQERIVNLLMAWIGEQMAGARVSGGNKGEKEGERTDAVQN